jgi:hypothetical protein
MVTKHNLRLIGYPVTTNENLITFQIEIPT